MRQVPFFLPIQWFSNHPEVFQVTKSLDPLKAQAHKMQNRKKLLPTNQNNQPRHVWWSCGYHVPFFNYQTKANKNIPKTQTRLPNYRLLCRKHANDCKRISRKNIFMTFQVPNSMQANTCTVYILPKKNMSLIVLILSCALFVFHQGRRASLSRCPV